MGAWKIQKEEGSDAKFLKMLPVQQRDAAWGGPWLCARGFDAGKLLEGHEDALWETFQRKFAILYYQELDCEYGEATMQVV
jgi:hypothetical protein